MEESVATVPLARPDAAGLRVAGVKVMLCFDHISPLQTGFVIRREPGPTQRLLTPG